MDLNTTWFLLVGVLIVGYAVLDGFDLGVGSLYYLLAKTDEEKSMLLNSIGPVWDGNEVWLLTGGGALFAAFPLVYATVFSGFYLAMMLVLLGLIFRAVSLEYRRKIERPDLAKVFDGLFFAGSLIPALLFGVAVGNVVRGLPLDTALNYSGTFFQLLNPYALVLGLVGLMGFLLQGATYTMLKTDGVVFERAKKLSRKIWLAFVALYILATVYSLYAAPHLFANYQQQFVLYVIPLATWGAMLSTPVLIKGGKILGSLIASSASLAGIILILAAGLYPKLVPAEDPQLSLTIYNASSSPLTLKVMLIIALTGVPIVLLYTTYVYRVFRGKVNVESETY
ncbi:cytochrome D oxidase subunit I [Clostridiales bacterium PH28_bin88]|nr:cytochrome D oxidase subunit I [Clostridiales bacterium PH28_bin88]